MRRTPATSAKSLQPELPSGDLVFLVGGPRTVEGVDWWQVASDRWSSSGSGPLLGWVPATGATSIQIIVPFASACPSDDGPIESEAIARIGALQALACFGGRDITVSGELRCSEGVRDGGAGGASWLNSYWWCSLDERLAVNGPSIDALRGRVLSFSPMFGPALATGHFDDREARQCSWVPVGVNLDTPVGDPDPGAVIVCRQHFVVTGLTGPGLTALDDPSAAPQDSAGRSSVGPLPPTAARSAQMCVDPARIEPFLQSGARSKRDLSRMCIW